MNIGLKPDEFWELSWYEWGLYLLREKRRSEDLKFKFETGWDQTRILWATIININSPKGKGVKPSELIELSFDKKVEIESLRKTPEEVASKFKHIKPKK